MVHQTTQSDSGDLRDMVVADTIANISRNGWAVIGVFPVPGEEGVNFSYTTGLSGKGLPEVAIYGLPAQAAGGVLNRVARTMVDTGNALQPGDWFDFEGKQARAESRAREDVLVAIEMLDTSDLNMVRTIYGEVKSAMQIVWPMRDGLMPWELGGTAVEEQPILGAAVKTPMLFRAHSLGDVHTFAELDQAIPKEEAVVEAAPTAQNDHRVRNAGEAFIRYAACTGICDKESDALATYLGDFLSDARHLADALDADWGELIGVADRNYRAEIHGDI
ncbi:DUF4262 domain-containing protein [Mycobacteroides salmoniphilum]|uniref:DUF4262 domain-containing protein n=1 Tax=Mycobacteroides salmoniphilum TaxID=404941 RepID=A0A4R8SZP1_9MYCO|nr:DUF4262 domain-containing protein [Mycobacteroides salmoniphilum]TEA09063.1 hypothetical protein CCUG60884_00231 [Mycobacteroides salmoniphilum]